MTTGHDQRADPVPTRPSPSEPEPQRKELEERILEEARRYEYDLRELAKT